MGFLDKIFKPRPQSTSMPSTKTNNQELLSLIEQYKSFPGFYDMLDTINLLSDIQSGKVNDNCITKEPNSGKIRILYQPNKSEPNHQGLTLSVDTKTNRLLARVFKSNTSDLSTRTSIHGRSYDLATQIEELRVLQQFDPHTYQLITAESFIRHDTDVEKVIHTRYDQNGKPIIKDTLDISHSPCDIASLDACAVDDTGLFNMRCEGKTDSWAIVQNKIQASVCKAGLCARIKTNNDLRKFDTLGNMFGQTDYSDKEILSIEGSRRLQVDHMQTLLQVAEEMSPHSSPQHDGWNR